MEIFSLNNLALIDIQNLIDRALEIEVSWDFEVMSQILTPLWSDFTVNPDFSDYEIKEKAFLLRIAGNFLIKAGRSKNLDKQCIERGKDLLSISIRLFQDLNDVNNEIEAGVILAYAYYLEGQNSEFETFLNDSENKLDGKHFSETYLLIQVNRLVYYHRKEEFTKSFELIKNLKPLVDLCSSQKIKRQFYNEAGLIHRKRKEYTEAAEFYKLAAKAALRSKNRRSAAMILNNRANLLLHLKQTKFALKASNESIAIYRELGDKGWLAHGFDTNAQIYFADGNFDDAFKFINKAVRYFYEGTDYRGLADSLWFKTKMIFSLNKDEQATIIWKELQDLISKRLDEDTRKHFENKLMVEFRHKISLPKESKIISSTPIPEKPTEIEPLKVIPLEKLVLENLPLRNIKNILLFRVPAIKAEDLIFSRKEIIILIEIQAILSHGDQILFETPICKLEIGEVIGPRDWTGKSINPSKLKIEISGTSKKLNFTSVDHVGKILGFCAAEDLKKEKISFQDINDLV